MAPAVAQLSWYSFSALGSGPRYMIRVTHFCNVQKRATKSDTSGPCLLSPFFLLCSRVLEEEKNGLAGHNVT